MYSDNQNRVLHWLLRDISLNDRARYETPHGTKLKVTDITKIYTRLKYFHTSYTLPTHKNYYCCENIDDLLMYSMSVIQVPSFETFQLCHFAVVLGDHLFSHCKFHINTVQTCLQSSSM